MLKKSIVIRLVKVHHYLIHSCCRDVYYGIRSGFIYYEEDIPHDWEYLPEKDATETERIEAAGKATVCDVFDYSGILDWGNDHIEEFGYYNCYTDEHKKGDITYYDASDSDISRLTYSVTLAELYE